MVIKSDAGDKVFISWSGGKDSYLSLLLAKEKGLVVESLLSFVSADGQSRSHGLKTEILQKQAELLGISLETEEVTWESYEKGFERAVKRLREERDISGGVFGDINLAEHREWVEKMCRRCKIKYNLPLWQVEEIKVSEMLIALGGEALVVAIRSDLIDESWLGRIMDKEYVDYCLAKGISPCGEGGEAHTLVTAGPLFSDSLKYGLGKIRHEENRALLEINICS
ncbi:MAG: diphthine--ammonia ligase [Bacillota bacterium]